MDDNDPYHFNPVCTPVVNPTPVDMRYGRDTTLAQRSPAVLATGPYSFASGAARNCGDGALLLALQASDPFHHNRKALRQNPGPLLLAGAAAAAVAAGFGLGASVYRPKLAYYDFENRGDYDLVRTVTHIRQMPGPARGSSLERGQYLAELWKRGKKGDWLGQRASVDQRVFFVEQWAIDWVKQHKGDAAEPVGNPNGPLVLALGPYSAAQTNPPVPAPLPCKEDRDCIIGKCVGGECKSTVTARPSRALAVPTPMQTRAGDCEEGQKRCPDGTCIPKELVCVPFLTGRPGRGSAVLPTGPYSQRSVGVPRPMQPRGACDPPCGPHQHCVAGSCISDIRDPQLARPTVRPLGTMRANPWTTWWGPGFGPRTFRPPSAPAVPWGAWSYYGNVWPWNGVTAPMPNQTPKQLRRQAKISRVTNPDPPVFPGPGAHDKFAPLPPQWFYHQAPTTMGAPFAGQIPTASPGPPPGVFGQGGRCYSDLDCRPDKEYCHTGICLPKPWSPHENPVGRTRNPTEMVSITHPLAPGIPLR